MKNLTSIVALSGALALGGCSLPFGSSYQAPLDGDIFQEYISIFKDNSISLEYKHVDEELRTECNINYFNKLKDKKGIVVIRYPSGEMRYFQDTNEDMITDSVGGGYINNEGNIYFGEDWKIRLGGGLELESLVLGEYGCIPPE